MIYISIYRSLTNKSRLSQSQVNISLVFLVSSKVAAQLHVSMENPVFQFKPIHTAYVLLCISMLYESFTHSNELIRRVYWLTEQPNRVVSLTDEPNPLAEEKDVSERACVHDTPGKVRDRRSVTYTCE